MEETQVRTKTQKRVWNTGLKFSNNGQRREEKNGQLESCELPEINKALDNFALEQVISSAPGQLRINFTCIFKVFQIALVASRLGQLIEITP